jgi:kinesin family protein 1
MVIVKDLVDKKDDRKFEFDHALWSYDGFKNREDGYSEPINDKYVDQEKVWKLLGEGVLEKAWKGLNCTVFAYGQTGSGKSYSTFGYGNNKGIVPMAADKIFERIRGNTDPNISF